MKTLFCILFSFLSFSGFAQSNSYPQNYFRNPLEIPISLSGGFGECRPNHFHTGLDMKTNQQENLKVLAAADGYIYRVSISHSGYGNCLYVRHPNGYTTVYGHLNDFFPELQKYVVAQQYREERWNIELYPPQDLFPVKKGALIAYSGNTGGSTGPHLHFEIRNSETEKVLNGFLFGLPIKDTKAPVIKSLAIYNGNVSIYQQDPKLIPVSANGKNYKINSAVLTSTSPVLFFGVQAQDYIDNSTNWLGIYTMKLFKDDQLELATRLQEIDLAQNRYMNAYADFKTKEKTGNWYQGLYQLPNNELDVYTYVNKKFGKVDISDGNIHQIRIEIADPYQNSTSLNFSVRYDGDSIQSSCSGQVWRWQEGGSLETKTIKFSAGNKAFYDDICFQYTETPSSKYWSNVVQLSSTELPIQDYCQLSLKLNQPVPFALRTKLVFMHHIRDASLPGNNPQSGVAIQYDQSWGTGKIRTFGNYYVDIDTIAPKILPLQNGNNFSQAKSIGFKVEDDKTSVAEFRGTIDGQWVRFVRSGKIYTYQFDDYCPPGKHELVIYVEDENKNARSFTLNFTR